KKGLGRNQSPAAGYPAPSARPGDKNRGAVRSPDVQKASGHPAGIKNGVPAQDQPVADEFYFRLMKDKPALAPILKVATKVEVKDKTIQFTFSQDKKHFAVLIEQNQAYLKRLAAELDGHQFELKIEDEGQQPAPEIKPKTESKKVETAARSEARLAVGDPKVKTVLDSLRGQVIAVKKKTNSDKS
ncbi:MAG: hypothetical protein WC524_07725, partial [Candidatus Aminicenantales bacterium]